ncbi:MAG: VOC family protein [Nevskiales bacterium]|nr:VOC family protein [Nevskiales bacterium]
MQIQPYLFFEGRCEEALAFYTKAIDAEVTRLMHYRESPIPTEPGHPPPGNESKVMHAHVRIGDAEFMASDGLCTGKPSFKGFSLSLALPDAAQANRTFAALAEGGRVDMPLAKTFWSPCFGMVTDRFGVQWMITLVPRREE